jgi:ribosomal protein S18 acetylase RimI-like enzyme
VSWAQLSSAGLTYAPSRADSDRFGVTVARASLGQSTTFTKQLAADVDDALRSEDEVVIVRFPASLTEIPAVVAASGRAVLAADTLVYWSAEPQALVDAAPAGPPEGFSIGRGAVDPARLTQAVVATFEDYPNHYAVNPAFPADQALAGYVEWALRSATADPDGLIVLEEAARLVGFATWSTEEGVAEIELAGLVPSARGRGLYAHLLAEVGRSSAARGCRLLVISTQAGNARVQRAWIRAGLSPLAAFTTLHAVR